MARQLPFSFYRRDTAEVARDLLGKRLVHIVDGRRRAGIIVETEAYIGAEDRACHGYGFRRTARTESLFQSGGHSYVYFIYGMHYCFNVVTKTDADPEAVLIRAIEPTEGLDLMRAARRVRRDQDLTNGPGKLCAALGIDKRHDRLALRGGELFIEDSKLEVLTRDVVKTPRIGVAYAGTAAHWPLRFYVRGNRFVSKTPAPSRIASRK